MAIAAIHISQPSSVILPPMKPPAQLKDSDKVVGAVNLMTSGRCWSSCHPRNGGSGKTWAAKALYRAAKTSNLFDEYIWVSLSINYSMRKCFNKIAASLSCKIRDGLSVESTRTTIKEYLTPRKFLLVLDNAYFTEESILEYLGVPDPRQQRLGSKIFVKSGIVQATNATWPFDPCPTVQPSVKGSQIYSAVSPECKTEPLI
ncbi:disease resistance protein RPS2-like [Panicum miliaceum]|uniref:Disease resistance protein RPS2-like n=1 Tax=Panicum miliaceum TaxID=4540 RepID=A0A3L6SKP3_PANMI|nr:disease resistance protein RPS2-like [Panicum miliaceum]